MLTYLLAARRYVNHEIDAKTVAAWLQKYAVTDEKRAKQSAMFIEKCRSYVIDYNLSEDMVRGYIEKRAGTEQQHLKQLSLSRCSSLRRRVFTPKIFHSYWRDGD